MHTVACCGQGASGWVFLCLFGSFSVSLFPKKKQKKNMAVRVGSHVHPSSTTRVRRRANGEERAEPGAVRTACDCPLHQRCSTPMRLAVAVRRSSPIPDPADRFRQESHSPTPGADAHGCSDQ